MSGVPNPAAFPVASDGAVQPGMMLRDYFAAKALPIAWAETAGTWSHVCPDSANRCAEAAYVLADAMLAARTEGGPA